MKIPIICGIIALVVALILIFGRTALSGKTSVHSDVVITERDEVREHRLIISGSVMGGLGALLIIAGVLTNNKLAIKRLPRSR